jgi:glycerophosphoryl diester phosphodiesterase
MPLVIALGGASGYRPEHTLAAYELAARVGADFVEVCLVTTKDGVLVARGDNEISRTTDVALRRRFRDRRTTKLIDGRRRKGWFTEDFDLDELKALRAIERIPELRQRNTIFDRRYEVPTLDEVVALTERLAGELPRPIGLYLTLRHPTYFGAIGLPLEPPLLSTMTREDLDHAEGKLFVQSDEVAILKTLRRDLHVQLTQLLGPKERRPYDFTVVGDPRTYGALALPDGLRQIVRYADAVAPPKNYIVPRDDDDVSKDATSFVTRAHRVDLIVHPYAFRNENLFLPAELRSGSDPSAYGDAFGEYERFHALTVDGVFSDHPDTARAALPT